MKERGSNSYRIELGQRTFALDAKENALAWKAFQGDPKTSAPILTALIGNFKLLAPATGRFFTADARAEMDDQELNPLLLLACMATDAATWLAITYVNRYATTLAIVPERLVANSATHAGIDAIKIGSKKVKNLFSREQEVGGVVIRPSFGEIDEA